MDHDWLKAVGKTVVFSIEEKQFFTIHSQRIAVPILAVVELRDLVYLTIPATKLYSDQVTGEIERLCIQGQNEVVATTSESIDVFGKLITVY